MTMINCSKEKYREALAERKPTRAEHIALQNAAHGLFKYLEFGRQIAVCTWLMVARADTRGKRALARLDLNTQHELVSRLRAECPAFFEGMLVPETQLASSLGSASGSVVCKVAHPARLERAPFKVITLDALPTEL